MANDNKRFLDKIGVQYLWDKINEYFSQIGHRHETSDVNGLDEYMEENAKAIRDTEKVVEELSELPLYPSEEQLGIIYACNGKLYRAKKLNTLTLDFSKIEGDEEGNVTQEIIRDFINKNGMNIVMEYGNYSDIKINTVKKYNNGIYVGSYIRFYFEDRNGSDVFNHWNNIYIKSVKITAQSPYSEEDEETYQGCVEIGFDDYNEEGVMEQNWWLDDNYQPSIQNSTYEFPYTYIDEDDDEIYVNLPDFASFDTYHEGCPFTLLKLELELVTCNSLEDYEEGIFHDFLVWEEVSEEELEFEDTTPATEDTRKRFYREIGNNNIYVTDAEYSPGEGGFVIDIVHPKTGGQINDTDELRGYIDPSEVWIDSVNGIEQIYGDNRYWLNDLGERVTITPIRVGTKSNSGSISLSTKTDVDLYFSPYISFNASTQEAIIEQDYTTIEVDDADAGEIIEYEVEVFDNINLLEKKWTIVHVPVSPEVYINTNRRCYLHKIVKKGEGEGDKYYWSQIAKIKDLENAIDALAPVAKTGCYNDLECKPFIGDVQTFDLIGDEFPPIDITDEKLIKTLYRYQDALYTAALNEPGVNIDLGNFSKKYETYGGWDNNRDLYLRNYMFEYRLGIPSSWGEYKRYFFCGDNYLIQNTIGKGLQLGTSGDYGKLQTSMVPLNSEFIYQFNKVKVELQSWSSDGEYTTDNGNVYIEIGTTNEVATDNQGHGIYDDYDLSMQKREHVYFEKYKRYEENWVNTDVSCENDWYDDEEDVTWFFTYDDIQAADVVSAGDIIKIGDSDELTVVYVDNGEGVNYFAIRGEYYADGEIFKKEVIAELNPLQTVTIELSGNECDYLRIYTQDDGEEYGRRVVIKSIYFEDLHFTHYENPQWNVTYEKGWFWKKITGSGNGIKVIDLTGDE